MQQKIFIGLVLTLIIVIFVPIYWATESGRQEAARERLKTEAVEKGAKLYTSSCALCHGSKGEGKIAPALTGTQLDRDALRKIIARGIPGTSMLAWGNEDGGPLTSHQIEDLVAFIKNWDSALLSTPTPPPTPIPSSINASELFAGKCAACHGKGREGISKLGPALNPQSLAGLSDNEIRDIISGGRLTGSMPPFNNILSSEEINALLQFIKYTSP